MSKTIDERVVEMRFDNKQFEQNVQTSISSIEKLEKSLNLKGASKGLDDVNAAAKKLQYDSAFQCGRNSKDAIFGVGSHGSYGSGEHHKFSVKCW